MKYDLSNSVEKKTAISKLKKYIDEKKIVEIKLVNKKRTLTQNAYLHVCISLYAIEFGYTLYEAKTYLKRNCGFMTYEKNGDKYLKHTSDSDTKELTEFIDWIRNYSGMNGYYIPTPEEYLTNQTMIDRDISRHKEFL